MIAVLRLLAAALLFSHADAAANVLRKSAALKAAAMQKEGSQTLRVCNAFPLDAPLDVFLGHQKLTEAASLPYKKCKDFPSQLKSGDRIQFKVGASKAGTFEVSAPPQRDAVLLLVVNRHDTRTNSVSFESHVFSSMPTAQVAIIDTFKGSAQTQLYIKDAETTGKAHRTEHLNFNGVVAVKDGHYDILLANKLGKAQAKGDLTVQKGQSYVVLRTGIEAETGQSFPQELVIFPSPDAVAAKEKSSPVSENWLSWLTG